MKAVSAPEYVPPGTRSGNVRRPHRLAVFAHSELPESPEEMAPWAVELAAALEGGEDMTIAEAVRLAGTNGHRPSMNGSSCHLPSPNGAHGGHSEGDLRTAGAQPQHVPSVAAAPPPAANGGAVPASAHRRAVAEHVRCDPGNLDGLAVDISRTRAVGFVAPNGDVHFRDFGDRGGLAKGGWRWNKGADSKQIYTPFPDRDSAKWGALFITEGETSAITAAANLGVAAIGTMGGAKTGWPGTANPSELAGGRRAVIWMDGDEAGRAWAESVAGAFVASGVETWLVPTIPWRGLAAEGRAFASPNLDPREVWIRALLAAEGDYEAAAANVLADLAAGIVEVKPEIFGLAAPAQPGGGSSRRPLTPPTWRPPSTVGRPRRRFDLRHRDDIHSHLAAGTSALDLLAGSGHRAAGGFNPGRSSSVRCGGREHANHDKNPSAVLSPRPGGGYLFYCHGCGDRGDTVTLFAALVGMSATEVLTDVARQLGIP